MTEQYQQVKGVSLAYEAAGRGQPLVCVHGNFASKRWFTEQLEAPPEGCQVIALDLPNFGASEAMPEPISVAAYAEYVAGFLDALELEPPVLLGHSFGGAVVQKVAVERPDRVSGLVLLSSAPPAGLKTPEEHYPLLELFKTNRELLSRSLAATLPARHPPYFEAIVDDGSRMHPDAFQGNARALEGYDLRDAVSMLALPVLVLRGAQDNLISEAMARQTAQAWSGARLELWDNVGHSPQIEAPERFNRLLAGFLKGLK